jgi:hypothetical protein
MLTPYFFSLKQEFDETHEAFEREEPSRIARVSLLQTMKSINRSISIANKTEGVPDPKPEN